MQEKCLKNILSKAETARRGSANFEDLKIHGMISEANYVSATYLRMVTEVFSFN